MEFPATEAADLGGLVVPNGNSAASVHRWFHVKESFAAGLFARVVEHLSLTESVSHVVDPFGGAGTTAVSALDWARGSGRPLHVDLIEVNPFLHFLATAKSAAVTSTLTDLSEARRKIEAGLRAFSGSTAIPPLSTLGRREYVSAQAVHSLLRIREAIRRADLVPLERDLALVALAGSVEPCTSLRRDGRTLRYEPDKVRARPLTEFRRRLALIEEDLTEPAPGSARVIHGDGRAATEVIKHGAADLVLFSPPYPNNLDYTEIYKLEGWLLGMYTSPADFRGQRARTFRSHPSVLFEDARHSESLGVGEEVDGLLAPVLAAAPDDHYVAQRRRLVRGYFEDLLKTLVGLKGITGPGAHCVAVVGNSLHGRGGEFLIATDLLLAQLAEFAGWDVVEIAVARRPARRGASARLLRESVVTLRRE